MDPEVILLDFNINVTSQERKQTDEDQIEIVEIVAKSPNKGFEKYILPTGAITPRATQYHGIYKKDGKMFDRNSWRQAALPCLNPYEGLTAFVKWIDDVRKESQEIILMAHNNKFFHSDILAHNLMKLEISLPNYIHFSDSIHLMKKIQSIDPSLASLDVKSCYWYYFGEELTKSCNLTKNVQNVARICQMASRQLGYSNIQNYMRENLLDTWKENFEDIKVLKENYDYSQDDQEEDQVLLRQNKENSLKPSEITNNFWIYEWDPEIRSRIDNYDDEKSGKWMMFFENALIDEKWQQLVNLYREGKLTGIHSMKVSTAKESYRSSDHSTNVICLYCGPYDDKEYIMKVGENLLHHMDYRNNSGFMCYKSDMQTFLGTRATGNKSNSMYKIPILLSDPFEKRKILLDIQKRFVERIEHKIQMVKNQSDGKNDTSDTICNLKQKQKDLNEAYEKLCKSWNDISQEYKNPATSKNRRLEISNEKAFMTSGFMKKKFDHWHHDINQMILDIQTRHQQARVNFSVGFWCIDCLKMQNMCDHCILKTKFQANCNQNTKDKLNDNLKFLTWNIDGLDEECLEKRLLCITEQIMQLNPDVVFIQEANDKAVDMFEEYLKQSYAILKQEPHCVDYFTCILINQYTLQLDDFKTMQFANSEMGRGLQMVQVHSTNRDFKICLLNVHLESMKKSSKKRIEQLQECFSEIENNVSKDATVILAGDMNIRDQEIGELPQNVYDLWINLGKPTQFEFTWDCQKNTNKTFPGGKPPRLRFDRVFVRESSKNEITPKSFEFIGTKKVSNTPMFPSDHWGILAIFELN